MLSVGRSVHGGGRVGVSRLGVERSAKTLEGLKLLGLEKENNGIGITTIKKNLSDRHTKEL